MQPCVTKVQNEDCAVHVWLAKAMKLVVGIHHDCALEWGVRELPPPPPPGGGGVHLIVPDRIALLWTAYELQRLKFCLLPM